MRKKRLISWLLTFVMLFSVFPAGVYAAEPESGGMTNRAEVTLAKAVVGDDMQPTVHKFNVDFMTEDGSLDVLPSDANSFVTGETTTLANILAEFQSQGVVIEGEPMYMMFDGKKISDDFLTRTLVAGQTDIELYFTGCSGHGLSFTGTTGGTASLLVEAPNGDGSERVVLDGIDMTETSVQLGSVIRLGEFEAAEGYEGTPVLTVNGEAVSGTEYTVTEHGNVTVSAAFAEAPEVIVNPTLTLDITSDCYVSVYVDSVLTDMTSVATQVKAGSHVVIKDFGTHDEAKYDATQVTVRLGDKTSETVTGGEYEFIMPDADTRLSIQFAVKTAQSDGVYYIANSVEGGQTGNSGSKLEPMLSITEAIQAAQAANQETVKIVFKSDISETDVRMLNAVTMGSIKNLTIDGNGQHLIYNGQRTIGETQGFLEINGGVYVQLQNMTITRTQNDFQARLVHVTGANTVVDMQNVTLTGGWMDCDMTSGGSALWVERGATVNMDGYCKVLNNQTTGKGGHNSDVALAGAILVGTYGDAKIDRGVLNITGVNISGNTVSGDTGAGIYVMPRGELSMFASNYTITASDEIYLDVDSHATVGAVTGKSDKISLSRVFLAGNGEDTYKEATLDIRGETDNAEIGIEGSDSNHYAYRLISRQVDGYTIDADMFDRDTTMDEDGWTDLDGKWDIRYMVVQNVNTKEYVPGLYFIYKTANIQFHDTRTVDNIYGKDLTQYQVSTASGDVIRYLKHEDGKAVSEAPNAVITAADSNGAISGATGLKGEEMLYIPAIVPVGTGYVTPVEDYVVTFDVTDEYKLPPEARDNALTVIVSEVTSNGLETLSSADYTYEIRDGKGVITIGADKLASMKPGATLDVKLSAEKYYNLTVQMNGPLYTLTKITADGETTVEKKALVLTILPYQGDNLVQVLAGYDLDGNGTADTFREGVKVTLYAEGTVSGEVDSARILGTAETDADGRAEFRIGDDTYLPGESLNNQMSFFVVPYYEDMFRVVSSDTLTLDVGTIKGHRLRVLQDGAVEYVPSEITAQTENWSDDGDAAKVILTDTRADTRVICYSDLAQAMIFFDRNAPEGCTTANSTHCSWIFQSLTGGPDTVLASTDAPNDVRAKAMEASAITYGNLPSMQMTGYQFKGWSTDKDASEPNVFSYTPFDYLTSATTLYAVWAPAQVQYQVGHWIEYVSQTVDDPGSETSGQVQGRNPGFTSETPVLAVKGGVESEYANMEAASQAGAVISYYLAEQVVYNETADITLIGADVLPAEKFAAIGTDEGLSWWTLDGFTAKPQASVKVLADGTAVFMTKYDRNEYRVTYHAEPGVLDIEGHTTLHKFGDIVYSMAVATREGYDFANWIAKEAETGTPVTRTDIYVWARDIEVYATWTPHTDTMFTVKIMIENLNTDGVDATERGWFKAWQSHELAGWSNDSGADNKHNVIDPAEAIGAAWQPDGFTYAGYLEDGDLASLDAFSHPGSQIKNNGDSTFTVGHLNGNSTTVIYLYFTRNEASVTFSDGVLTEDGTILANPAPGNPAWQFVTVDDIPYHGQFGEFFPETNPTRAGYDFDGWQDKNGKRVNAEDYTEEFCDELLKQGSGNFTLYPIWKVRTGAGEDGYPSYYLTYMTGIDGRLDVTDINLDNASDLIASAVQPGGWVLKLPLTYDQSIGYMPKATRTGYDFTGWYLDADCTEPLVYSSELFRPAGDTTPVMTQDGWVSLIADVSNVFIKNDYNTVEQLRPLYAGYQAHQHTLVLDAAGGTFGHLPEGWSFVPGSNSQQVQKTVTYGEAIGQMPGVMRTGYEFTMWQLVDGDVMSQIDGDTVWSSTMTNGATLVATAKWVQNVYKYTLNLNDVDVGNGSTKAFLSDSSVTGVEIYYDASYISALSHVYAYRNGYTFLGWSLTQYNCESLIGGNTELELITAETVNNLPSDGVLYAVWMPNVYEMRVYLNGGSVDAINGNDENLQNMVFNQNAYAQRYYGDKTGSYQAVYKNAGVKIDVLYATVASDYISVPVVFDTVYGELPAASREGVDGDKYVFGGYLATAPAWRTMSNGMSVKVIDGRIVRALDSTTLAVTGGLFTDYQDDFLRLDAIWSPVFKFDAAHYGEPESGVSSSKTNLCVQENGEPNGDEHVLSLNGNGDVLETVIVKTDLTAMPVAEKAGFTFLGWFDNAGNKYTLDDLNRRETSIQLYARFTPTVTFLANFESETETNGGYVIIGGQKYGVYEIGLSELLAKYGRLPAAAIDDGRVFLGWHDKSNNADISLLANLAGRREPITLIPDYDYVAAFHLPAGAVWPEGDAETRIIRLSALTVSEYEKLRPSKSGSTFVGWTSTAYPYQNMGLDDLLVREDGKFTKSYSLIAAFMTGGEDVKPETGIEIVVVDYTNGKVSVAEMTDGKLSGKAGEALDFTVACDEVCVVALRRNGELTELKCNTVDGGYMFTIESAAEGDEVVIALLGDINLNGEANSEDLALFARYTFNEYAFDAEPAGLQELVADINHNGEANSEDLALFARYTFNEYDFGWNQNQ